MLTGDLPEYKVSRNKLFLPEFLTEKRIRILWVSSYRGNFWGSESQNYSSALLKTYENTEKANFQALIKPLTVLEVFNNIFLKSNPGEIYNPGLRQAAFGEGYKKESVDALYEATQQITGTENVVNSGLSDGFSLDEKWKKLPKKIKDIILYGSDEDEIKFNYDDGYEKYSYKKSFEGVINNLERRFLESDSEWKREAIAEYQSDTACEACNGDRLKEEALCVKINDLN